MNICRDIGLFTHCNGQVKPLLPKNVYLAILMAFWREHVLLHGFLQVGESLARTTEMIGEELSIEIPNFKQKQPYLAFPDFFKDRITVVV